MNWKKLTARLLFPAAVAGLLTVGALATDGTRTNPRRMEWAEGTLKENQSIVFPTVQSNYELISGNGVVSEAKTTARFTMAYTVPSDGTLAGAKVKRAGIYWGEPIRTKDWYEAYYSNPSDAFRSVMDSLPDIDLEVPDAAASQDFTFTSSDGLTSDGGCIFDEWLLYLHGVSDLENSGVYTDHPDPNYFEISPIGTGIAYWAQTEHTDPMYKVPNLGLGDEIALHLNLGFMGAEEKPEPVYTDDGILMNPNPRYVIGTTDPAPFYVRGAVVLEKQDGTELYYLTDLLKVVFTSANDGYTYSVKNVSEVQHELTGISSTNKLSGTHTTYSNGDKGWSWNTSLYERPDLHYTEVPVS